MQDDANVPARRALREIYHRTGALLDELRARLDAIEQVIEPMQRRLEAVEREVEREVAPLRTERFWVVALGPWQPVLQDAGFAGLVDLVEQEAPEYLAHLLILFQRAIVSDGELRETTNRLAANVKDLGWRGTGGTGEAHQVAVNLDWISTQLESARTQLSEVLGPSASSIRDLLTMARARRARGECPGWVVARLKAALTPNPSGALTPNPSPKRRRE